MVGLKVFLASRNIISLGAMCPKHSISLTLLQLTNPDLRGEHRCYWGGGAARTACLRLGGPSAVPVDPHLLDHGCTAWSPCYHEDKRHVYIQWSEEREGAWFPGQLRHSCLQNPLNASNINSLVS